MICYSHDFPTFPQSRDFVFFISSWSFRGQPTFETLVNQGFRAFLQKSNSLIFILGKALTSVGAFSLKTAKYKALKGVNFQKCYDKKWAIFTLFYPLYAGVRGQFVVKFVVKRVEKFPHGHGQ